MSAKNRNIVLVVIVLLLVLIGIMVLRNNNNSSQNNTYGTANTNTPASKQPAQNPPVQIDPFIQTKNMVLSSTAFNNNQPIPLKYTCDGQNVNPPLTIFGTPAAAKSLALILHDPDAPLAGGFTHWVMFNFDRNTKSIKENNIPRNAVQGKNGAGKNAYIGPCPPSGVHHYQFKIFALDSNLVLDSSTTKTDLERAIQGHVLDDALLVGTYQKKAAAQPGPAK